MTSTTTTTGTDQERWQRVKNRLRAEVGDDIFMSWFARMDLEAIEEGAVRLSVPTRFLKSWIQSHYAERVLACWQAQETNVTRVELIVRSAVLKSAMLPKVKPDLGIADNGGRYTNGNGRPLSVAPASRTRAMFWWSIRARAWRSASNRAMTCSESMPGLIIFSATRLRTGFSCSAR